MKKRVSVGLIAAPKQASDMVKKLLDHLINEFSVQIDESVDWEIIGIRDALTGAIEDSDEIIEHACKIKVDLQWDYAFCITDLPIFHEKDIVAARVNDREDVALLSIPAFGLFPVRKRIERMMTFLLEDWHRQHKNDPVEQAVEKSSWMRKIVKLFPLAIESRSPEETVFREKRNFSHVVKPRFYGLIRLLFGMTLCNYPFQMMAAFKRVIAIAFATGAFAIIFPTIWKLAQFFSIYRLTSIMIAAILGLVFWIIAAHHLWEQTTQERKKSVTRLYNIATASTLLIDVIFYYLLLYILFLLTASILIPPEYFSDVVKNGYEITYKEYLRVAWLAASISTIVSAIGAGLEDEERVKDITYGHRQRIRYKNVNSKQ